MNSQISRDAARVLLSIALLIWFLPAKAQETTTYDYDPLGRLVEVVYEDGTTIDYDHDAAGNRVSRTVGTGGGSPPPPPPNSPPVAVNDVYFNLDPTNDTFVTPVLNDTDADGDPLVVSAVTQPTNASVFLWFGGTIRIIPLVPDSMSSFTYTVSDGNGGTDTGQITISIEDDLGGGGGIGLF